MGSAYTGPADRLAWYEALIATNPDVERKGATMPYTSRNGHMFSFLDASGSMALRLPKESLEDFLAQYGTTLAEQHGRTMSQYAVVPDEVLARTDELRGWFARSYEWIGTLKPKASRR